MSNIINLAILLFFVVESAFGTQIPKKIQSSILEQPLSAHILGRVVQENGLPINDLEILATHEGESIITRTDGNGNFDLNVFASVWWIRANAEELDERHLLQPFSLVYTVEDNTTNSGADILVRSMTGTIVGRVYDTNNTGVASVQLSCEAVIGNCTYYLVGSTDLNGNYRFNVCDGTWTITPQGIDGQGYQNPPSQDTTVLNSTNLLDFIAFPLPPLELTTSYIPNALVGIPYYFQIQATGGAPLYIWLLSSGSLPAGLDLFYDGTITGTPTEASHSVFTVTLLDNQGLLIDKEFTMSSTYPFFLTMRQTAFQDIELQLNGETNKSYILEYSPRLPGTNWIPLFTNKAVEGVTLFTNVTTPDSMRFYRARQF